MIRAPFSWEVETSSDFGDERFSRTSRRAVKAPRDDPSARHGARRVRTHGPASVGPGGYTPHTDGGRDYEYPTPHRCATRRVPPSSSPRRFKSAIAARRLPTLTADRDPPPSPSVSSMHGDPPPSYGPHEGYAPPPSGGGAPPRGVLRRRRRRRATRVLRRHGDARLLRGVTAAVVNYSPEDTDAIRNELQMLGARVRERYTPDCTHLMTPYQQGRDYKEAATDGKIVVSCTRWLRIASPRGG